MKFIFTLTILFISSASLAKIHLEPYIGYSGTLVSSEEATKETISSVKKSYDYVISGKKYTGLTGGMRLGYRKIGLAFGLDISLGRWEALNKNPEVLIALSPGVFASYNLPLLFRVYGTLMPQTILSINNKTQDKTPIYCGDSRGAKVGASYISIPFLSVNLEYQSLYLNGDSEICKNWAHTGTVSLNFMF